MAPTMASSDPVPPWQLQSTIEFAVNLRSQLQQIGRGGGVNFPFSDLSQHVQTVRDASQGGGGRMPRRTAKDLDKCGRELWNMVGRMRRDGGDTFVEEDKDKSGFLIHTQFFAFHLMELGRSARRLGGDAEPDVVHLIRLAMSLGRSCIRASELECARRMLQKVAELIERLRTVTGNGVQGDLEARFLALRATLSWKEDRLDVAEHMFGKTESLRRTLSAPSAELIADTLQHIGFDFAAKGDNSMAIKWLRRAFEIVDHQRLDRLSAYGLKLRLALCRGIFRCLLNSGAPEDLEKAADLVAYVESEIGDTPVVLHWRLELLQKSPGEVFDVDAYVVLLQRMMRSFDFSDGTFHFLLHHIRGLRERSSRLACQLLDELLRQHVLQSDKIEWLNKVLVSRVWIGTTETGTAGESSNAPADIKNLFDGMRDHLPGPLRPDVAGAIHSLMWKKIQALLGERNHGLAEAWCAIALHRCLSTSGEANMEKFQRKLIICAIGLNDPEKARSTFQSMSEGARNHCLTRYLMFKVSLLSWDYDLARESIEVLSKARSKNQSRDLLYACIKEAQQAGDRVCVLTALKGVAEDWAADKVPEGNLPCLLRCAIGIGVRIEDDADDVPMAAAETSSPGIMCAEDLCSIFEKAANHAKHDPKDEHGNRLFTVEELDWFRKNAYNRGAAKVDEWEPGYIIRILRTCLVFIDCYPGDMPLSEATERTLMAMRCHFVIAAGLISIARTEDRVEERLQRYLEARRHVEQFDVLMQSEAITLGEGVMRDILTKASTLFVFDFEAATCLKSWDELNQIVRRAKLCRDEVMFKAMGDCLLRSQAPGKVMFGTMKLLINEIYELEEFDHEKLAKYIRCVFQAILPLDDGLAIQLVDQALQIAREGREAGRGFPEAEMEWLVATTFNHAIDYYARGEDEGCHGWAIKAMDLAGYVNDGGGLRNALQTKFAKLCFESR